MTPKELKKEFDSLKDELSRWKWIQSHQDTGITIMLDNDDTYGVLEDGDETLVFQLHEYIGSADGLLNLFAVIDINATFV